MQSELSGIKARVIADSIHGHSRLTTFEATFPRFVLAEFNTHRMLSRNSASSRAIPVWKRLVEIMEHPFIPLAFGKNKAGMQSAEAVSETDTHSARTNWLIGRDVAVLQAFALAGGRSQIMADAKDDHRARLLCERVLGLQEEYPDTSAKMQGLSAGVHKQHANRVLEPYAYHTVVVTGTHWRNFYALRASKDAQPEIRDLAVAMAKAHRASVPEYIDIGSWHLPFISDEDRKEISDPTTLARISSARCARVSYLTHDGKRSIEADFAMADRLQQGGHMSPFEHPAMPFGMITLHDSRYGNFGGWVQYRKMLQDEYDFSTLIPQDALLAGFEGDQELVSFVLGLSA